MKIHNQYARLRGQAEAILNRRITDTEISDATGIDTKTLIKLASQEMKRYDVTTIGKLLDYFNELGVNCTPSDWFIEIKPTGTLISYPSGEQTLLYGPKPVIR